MNIVGVILNNLQKRVKLLNTMLVSCFKFKNTNIQFLDWAEYLCFLYRAFYKDLSGF